MGGFVTAVSARHDVAIVHFPYVGQEKGKKRPVVVISNHSANTATGVAVVAMITRADAPGWHGDISLTHHDAAGLQKPCKIRMKFYTIDVSELVPVGQLQSSDKDALTTGLKHLFAL